MDGFWSISVYNAKGFFEKNALERLHAQRRHRQAEPGRLGDDPVRRLRAARSPNCLPIAPGWNYLLRLYRPRKEILDGTWKLPEAEPVS